MFAMEMLRVGFHQNFAVEVLIIDVSDKSPE